jgi:hypothetical protein
MSTITLDLDDDLKEKIQLFLKASGQDLSIAIINFLSKATSSTPSIVENTIKKENRSEAFGCLKGKISVPENFNEPLDDFKEYM